MLSGEHCRVMDGNLGDGHCTIPSNLSLDGFGGVLRAAVRFLVLNWIRGSKCRYGLMEPVSPTRA